MPEPSSAKCRFAPSRRMARVLTFLIFGLGCRAGRKKVIVFIIRRRIKEVLIIFTSLLTLWVASSCNKHRVSTTSPGGFSFEIDSKLAATVTQPTGAAFPPHSPRTVSRPCSNDSQVLFRCPIPRRRACGPYGHGLLPPSCCCISQQVPSRSPGSRA